jgi:hypothetical protein
VFISETWTHPERGPRGEALRTVTHLLPGDPDRLLVCISGTHGPEYFIGEKIQNTLMQSLPGHSRGATLLFVQGLNPFGTAWLRRGNHDNIDLNRNCWRGAPPSNPGFLNFLDLLSSRNSVEYWMRLAGKVPRMLLEGFPRASADIAQGQSNTPNSLFFTGRERAFEIIQLQKYLERFQPKKVFVLDIHTGLGPYAHESLILESKIPSDLFEQMQRHFGHKIIDLNKDQGFYPAFGALTNLFDECFPQSLVVHFTQEFGTLHFTRVLKALVLENSLWQQGRRDSPERFALLKDVFYPQDEDWIAKVHDTGIRRFKHLMELI